jgi:hypothetical protein
MDEVIKRYLQESVALELNIGDLYQLFSTKFQQDYNFWWNLSIEEMNHAAIIESIDDIFLTDSILPQDSIEIQTEELRKKNYFIREQISRLRINPLTSSEAFKLASELENSIGESHFEIFMTEKTNSTVVRIFQKLNGEDINHAKRIINYMNENRIE